LNPLYYSVWDILQEVVYKGWREPYADLHETDKGKKNKTGKRSMTKLYFLAVGKASSGNPKTGRGPI